MIGLILYLCDSIIWITFLAATRTLDSTVRVGFCGTCFDVLTVNCCPVQIITTIVASFACPVVIIIFLLIYTIVNVACNLCARLTLTVFSAPAVRAVAELAAKVRDPVQTVLL